MMTGPGMYEPPADTASPRRIRTDADRREEWRTRELGGVPAEPHPHRAVILNMLGRLQFESVMEFGCGTGENLVAINRRAWPGVELRGVDINQARIDMCQDRLPCDAIITCGDEYGLPNADLVLCDGICLIYEDPASIIAMLRNATQQWLVLSEWHANGRGTFRADQVEAGPDYWVHDFTERLGKPAYSWPYSKPDWPADRCDNWHEYGRIMAWSVT